MEEENKENSNGINVLDLALGINDTPDDAPESYGSNTQEPGNDMHLNININTSPMSVKERILMKKDRSSEKDMQKGKVDRRDMVENGVMVDDLSSSSLRVLNTDSLSRSAPCTPDALSLGCSSSMSAKDRIKARLASRSAKKLSAEA